MLTRTMPSACLVSALRSLVSENSATSSLVSACASSSPLGVRRTPCWVGKNSCEPMTSCSRLTWRLTVGWLVLRISAARLNDFALATARNTRSSPQNCPLRIFSLSSGV